MDALTIVTIVCAVLGIVATAALAIGGWALLEVVALGKKVAALEANWKDIGQRLDRMDVVLESINGKLDEALLHRRSSDR